jgi:hypothetical protein
VWWGERRRSLVCCSRILFVSGEFLVAHSMCQRSEIFGVSSVDVKIAASIDEKVAKCYCAMVNLDSNQTHEHVLGESNLNAS